MIKKKNAIIKETIFVIDDYSGSGSTIENIIREIEENYLQNEVYIIVYIWQKTAYEKISNLIEKQMNNYYHIYIDDETSLLLASLLSLIMIRMPSASLSSLMSAMPSSFFSLTRSAI